MINIRIIKKGSFKDKFEIVILENKILKRNIIKINIPTFWISGINCPNFKYYGIHLRYKTIKTITLWTI